MVGWWVGGRENRVRERNVTGGLRTQTPARAMSSRGDEGGGAGGGLAAWLRSLELDEYIDAFREAGYTSLRFVQMADINDIVGDVHMKRPHVRVFTPAWTELVEASTISERSSARTPEPPAESIGAALSARAERLASLASDEPVDGEVNDERAPLVVGQPSRPIQIVPSPIRSPAEFRAEITSRLTG